MGPVLRGFVAFAAIVTAATVTACGPVATTPAPRATAPAAPARTAAARPASVPAPAPAKKADEDDLVRPCRARTPEHAAAEAAVDALDKDVAALAPGGEGGATTAKVAALLATPCFALASGDLLEEPKFDSGLSARTWWSEGGESWLRHYLELGDSERQHDDNHPRWSWIPPTPRTTLTRESAKGSPLAPLLCPAADDGCGVETRGWLRRATLAFEAHGHAQRREALPQDPRAACAEKARKEETRGARYGVWRSCLRDAHPTEWALPLGRFRAPTQGWLVLRGRRGHYNFCDEVRAYDLATGASWTIGSCSGLALREDGSVDGPKTNAGRAAASSVGRVPVDALREAALATFLSPHVQPNVQMAGFGVALPDDLELVSNSAGSFGLGMSFGWSSGQTTVHWSWIVAGRPVATGDLTWPEDMNAPGRDHAVKLVQIAEAAFVPLAAGECAPAAPPVGELDALRARTCLRPASR